MRLFNRNKKQKKVQQQRRLCDQLYVRPNQYTFRSIHLIPYWIFASICIIALIIFCIMAKQEWYTIIIPDFVETILIKYDWLTILFFPLLAMLTVFPFFFMESRYKWFCYEITYRNDKNNILVWRKTKPVQINIQDVIRSDCRIRQTIFPLKERGSPTYTYYSLKIISANQTYRLYSIPFRRYEQPEDFLRFLSELRKAGLTIKMRKPLYKRLLDKYKQNK